MADDGVCDGSGLREGFPGQCSLLNLLCQFVSNGFKLSKYLKVEKKDEQLFRSTFHIKQVDNTFHKKEGKGRL